MLWYGRVPDEYRKVNLWMNSVKSLPKWNLAEKLVQRIELHLIVQHYKCKVKFKNAIFGKLFKYLDTGGEFPKSVQMLPNFQFATNIYDSRCECLCKTIDMPIWCFGTVIWMLLLWTFGLGFVKRNRRHSRRTNGNAMDGPNSGNF